MQKAILLKSSRCCRLEGEKMSEFQKNYSIWITDGAFLIGDTPEVHILYVVTGRCTVLTEENLIPLGGEDVFIINYHERAQVSLEKDSLIARISLDYFSFCRQSEQANLRFSLALPDPGGKWYDQLKILVEKLLLIHTGGDVCPTLSELSEYYALLCLLLQHVREADPPVKESGRVEKMLMVMQQGEDLSLQQLAAQMYLSPAVVSRLFQKATGEKFSQFKKRIRLEKVQSELISSQKPVTAIAMEAGYTSFTVFNRTFKETFGVTPSQYRKQFQEHSVQESIDPDMLWKVQQLLRENKDSTDKQYLVCRVEADVRQRTAWNPYRNRILTVGAAHLLLGANIQSQVEFLVQKLDIEYLRLWGLFSEQMLQGNGWDDTFSFSNLDMVLDFCVDHKLKLHFDLSPRRDFSPASEAREIYSRQSSKQYDWFHLLDAFLQHIRRCYTEETVSGWIFEFTFFLNEACYSKNQQSDFWDTWKRSYSLVKSILPFARVAGPGHICGNPQETKKIIGEFLECGCLPDIVTTINYPYYYEGSLKEQPIFQKELKKINDGNFLVGQVKAIQQILHELNFQGEYWVSDWGISFANRNFIQDSCYRASAVVYSLLTAMEDADSFNIFCASDLLSAYGDTGNVLCGSLGLLSQTGICKPVYYAYLFLHHLGRYKILQTNHCVITAEGEREYRILCFNNKKLGPRYFILPEDFHKPDSLDELFVDLKPMEMEIVLTGMPQRQNAYYIRQRILNEEQGGPLQKWIRLGCIPNLSRDDLELIERSSIPDGILEQRKVTNGELKLSFTMKPNEIRMIYIS